jgi:hypothetical protein
MYLTSRKEKKEKIKARKISVYHYMRYEFLSYNNTSHHKPQQHTVLMESSSPSNLIYFNVLIEVSSLQRFKTKTTNIRMTQIKAGTKHQNKEQFKTQRISFKKAPNCTRNNQPNPNIPRTQH